MKLTTLTGTLILLISTNVIGQHLNCEKFKNGYFKILADSIVQESIIFRKGNYQTESIKGEILSSELEVKWIDACTYTLTPTEQTLLQSEGIPKNAVLTIHIVETKKNSYIQKATSNFADFEIKTEVIKITPVEYEIFKNENSNHDSIKGQMKTAEKLKDFMNIGKYEEAISLFSLEQQENIREIRKDDNMFQYWCQSWTFDETKFERFKVKIKTGRAHFIFEQNEWKINEK